MNSQHKNSNLMVHEIGGDQCPKSVSWAEFLRARNNPERLFLVHLLSNDQQQLAHCLQSIEADPLVMERCVDL